MNNNLSTLLIGTPINIFDNLKLYQPTLKDIVLMSEEKYNAMLKIWTVSRQDLLANENQYTLSRNDFQIWSEYIIHNQQMQDLLFNSCLVFFHKKIEFYPFSNTMYIGEEDTGFLLDYDKYSSIKDLFMQLDYTQKVSKDNGQYKETENMSEREKRIYNRLKAGEQKLQKIRSEEADKQNALAKQIVALVAIGKYTFKEVYNMTMLQFINLLAKYIDIEQYELYTVLSPYISSKDSNQENKHWLN